MVKHDSSSVLHTNVIKESSREGYSNEYLQHTFLENTELPSAIHLIYLSANSVYCSMNSNNIKNTRGKKLSRSMTKPLK